VKFPEAIRVVDSHTEGEPTRVVVNGWPRPAGRSMLQRRQDLERSYDHLRSGVVCEPRGHDAMVGALLTPPIQPGSAAGVIFFNNVGYLGMCGHGTMGVVRTLAHLGRLAPGDVAIDTPAGTVSATLETDGAITVRNVPARVRARDVAVEVPGLGRVRGDVVYGGNWFYITTLPEAVELRNVEALTTTSRRIAQALRSQGITGDDGAEIDHIEVSAPPGRDDADARNFVLCPGAAYDRSPCGTGTCAKIAALHAAGRLDVGQVWRQESITGTLFTAWLEERDGALVPVIRGRAYITGETTLLFDPHDPVRAGFTSVR
jgi:4-hydroxyproline epimerase